jgi:Protein of unknown function (DUF2490)
LSVFSKLRLDNKGDSSAGQTPGETGEWFCVSFSLRIDNRVYLLAAVPVILLISESNVALAGGDFQLWNTAAASLDLNRDWKVSVEEMLKLNNDAGRFYYHHTDLSFVYGGLADWIDLGFSFKEAFTEDDAGHWSRENRPYLNVTVKGPVGALDVSDRSRFEYRDREYQKDLWRYVNRLKLKLPFELTRLKLRPYVADQIYLNMEGRAFDKNKIYFGASFKLSRGAESEIYYVWQSGKLGDQWQELNALGLQLKVAF